MQRAERSALGEVVALARAKIAAKCFDAQAHAQAALTDTLRATPEGRPTAARIRRNRSYLAALSRLDELGQVLVELVADFRVQVYQASWAFWREYVPAEHLRPATSPSQARMARCRALIVHGRTIEQTLRPAIERARGQLMPALVVAGHRGTPASDGTASLKRWATTTQGTLITLFSAVCVDGQTVADRMAGRDVLKPELLLPDPTFPV